jgi:hypothetical protein
MTQQTFDKLNDFIQGVELPLQSGIQTESGRFPVAIAEPIHSTSLCHHERQESLQA